MGDTDNDEDGKSIEGRVERLTERPSPLQGIRQQLRNITSTGAQRARNRLKEEQLRGAQLTNEWINAHAEVRRSDDRLKNIESEIRNDRALVKAEGAELQNRVDTAKAHADEITAEHKHRKAEAEASASEARTRKLEADLRAEELRQQLQDLKKRSGGGADLEALNRKIIEQRRRITEIDDEIGRLLMEDKDTELANEKRRLLEAERDQLNVIVTALNKRLLRLEGLI